MPDARRATRVKVDPRPSVYVVGPVSAVDRMRAWQTALDGLGLWASLRWADRAAWSLQAAIHERLLRMASAMVVLVAGPDAPMAVGVGLAAKLPVIVVVPEQVGRPPEMAVTGRVTILAARDYRTESDLAAHIATTTKAAIDGAAVQTDKHVAVLRRRAAYLETAIRTASVNRVLTHDKAELDALDWALWRVGAPA